jgi:hypothetical protein
MDFMLWPLACLKDDAPMLVSSFIDSSHMAWNNERLEKFFLPMDVEMIKSIPLCTRRMDDL